MSRCCTSDSLTIGGYMRMVCGIILLALTIAGCADEYIVFHSQTGEPLLLSRRAWTYEGCVARVKEDMARLGSTFRYLHVRGSSVGRSLLWPFEPGYACEAATGPEQLPSGVYPMGQQSIARRS